MNILKWLMLWIQSHYYSIALQEINPLHPDVPFLVLRLHNIRVRQQAMWPF